MTVSNALLMSIFNVKNSERVIVRNVIICILLN